MMQCTDFMMLVFCVWPAQARIWGNNFFLMSLIFFWWEIKFLFDDFNFFFDSWLPKCTLRVLIGPSQREFSRMCKAHSLAKTLAQSCQQAFPNLPLRFSLPWTSSNQTTMGSCTVSSILGAARDRAQWRAAPGKWKSVILPIDELHHVSRWLLHHQPDI